MKSVLIVFNQSMYDDILDIMDRMMIRGFTYLDQVKGRGSRSGEPRYGTHSWPEMNSMIVTVVEDHAVDPFLDELKRLDAVREALGLRAFVTDVVKSV